MTDDHSQTGGDRVAFVAHQDLVSALDAASADLGVTRSHYARARLAEILRSEGWLSPDAPASRYEARRRPIPEPSPPPTTTDRPKPAAAMNRSKQISFSAGEELFEAIEIEAYSRNETIANTLRQIVAKYLADSVLFDHRAPVTEQTAAINRLYVSKSARHARDAARARP